MAAARRALATVPLVAVAACSSTGCDPSRAGFLESLNCENGGFQSRQVVLQNSLAQAQANELGQQARAAEAQREAYSAQSDLAERRHRLAKLDAESATLRHRLQQAAARHNVDQKALAQARAEFDSLERQRKEVPVNDPDTQRLDTLSARQSKVLSILNTME